MVLVLQLVACLIVTLHIVDLWQYYVCCTRSFIPDAPTLVVYRCRMCQFRLHVVPWLHIRILVRLLAAEPHITARLLFPSVSLWNELADPVFDGVELVDLKSRANSSLLA